MEILRLPPHHLSYRASLPTGGQNSAAFSACIHQADSTFRLFSAFIHFLSPEVEIHITPCTKICEDALWRVARRCRAKLDRSNRRAKVPRPIRLQTREPHPVWPVETCRTMKMMATAISAMKPPKASTRLTPFSKAMTSMNKPRMSCDHK